MSSVNSQLDDSLISIFYQIINSYTYYYSEELGDLYIKHPSKFELLDFDKEYQRTYKSALSKGIPTKQKRELEILEQGHWTSKEEEDIKNNILFIDGMREQISQSFLLSKRKLLRREVKDAESKLQKLYTKKDFLIGRTAEKLASQQSTYYQVVNLIYKDKLFKEKLINEDIDNEQYNKLAEIYFRELNKLSIENIKKIALSSFFTSMYYMCDDNAYYFYGKPVVDLTDYQINLLMYGKYFKNLMSQYGEKLPDFMGENPDDIIEWFEITKNVEKSGILEEKEGDTSAMSVTGATKEDLKIMGINPSQIVNIGDKLKKSGKSILTKEDLADM